jgi:hypothetical protein
MLGQFSRSSETWTLPESRRFRSVVRLYRCRSTLGHSAAATQFGAPPHDDTRRALPELLIWFLPALQHLGARKREQRVVQAVSERIISPEHPI